MENLTENQLYIVVGKKSGQLVEISALPMNQINCKKFIKDQGIEKYYTDVDTIRYRGKNIEFKY